MSNFLAIDFETANTQRDSACSIGLVRVEGGIIVRKNAYLIRPPTREFLFTYIHGITWNDVESAPDFGGLWDEISPYFENIDFMAAHNASFDSRVLMACCNRYGIQMPKTPFTCTVQVARQQWKIHPTKLSDVCRALKIPLQHHEALSDATACAHIVLAASAETKKAEGCFA